MNRWLKILPFLVVLGCSQNDDERFIEIDDLVEKVTKEDLPYQELDFNISEVLYLNPNLYSEIALLDSSVLKGKKVDYFKITEGGMTFIQLQSSYESIRHLIKNPDTYLDQALSESFSLTLSENQIKYPVLTEDDKALITFYVDDGIYSLIFELIEPSKVRLGIAYIIVS